MATLCKEIHIQCKPETLWAAIKNVEKVNELFPGVLAASRMADSGSRIITFANGMEIREAIVTVDDAAKRFVYAATESALTTHHNASWQVFEGDSGGARFVWISDFLPNTVAPQVEELVRNGCEALKKHLES